jgi:hypothetical protein
MADLYEQFIDLIRMVGSDDEAARCALTARGSAALPYLAGGFARERDPASRASLVHIAWQCRTDGAIPLLLAALHDPSAEVWKEALDGFVTLATPAALSALRAFRAAMPAQAGSTEVSRDWVDEAIEPMEGGPSR